MKSEFDCVAETENKQVAAWDCVYLLLDSTGEDRAKYKQLWEAGNTLNPMKRTIFVEKLGSLMLYINCTLPSPEEQCEHLHTVCF